MNAVDTKKNKPPIDLAAIIETPTFQRFAAGIESIPNMTIKEAALTAIKSFMEHHPDIFKDASLQD